MRHLDLSFNKFKIIPDVISTLKGLCILELNSNEIEKLPKDIGVLKNLDTLDLEVNKLTKLPDSFYKLNDEFLEVFFSGNSYSQTTIHKIKEAFPSIEEEELTLVNELTGKGFIKKFKEAPRYNVEEKIMYEDESLGYHYILIAILAIIFIVYLIS